LAGRRDTRETPRTSWWLLAGVGGTWCRRSHLSRSARRGRRQVSRSWRFNSRFRIVHPIGPVAYSTGDAQVRMSAYKEKSRPRTAFLSNCGALWSAIANRNVVRLRTSCYGGQPSPGLPAVAHSLARWAKAGLPTEAQVRSHLSEGWWTAGGSNSRPPRCERGAL